MKRVELKNQIPKHLWIYNSKQAYHENLYTDKQLEVIKEVAKKHNMSENRVKVFLSIYFFFIKIIVKTGKTNAKLEHIGTIQRKKYDSIDKRLRHNKEKNTNV